MEVRSVMGSWQGEWSGIGETLCLYFTTGPAQGETCVSFVRVAEGGYKGSNGTLLRPVERDYRF